MKPILGISFNSRFDRNFFGNFVIWLFLHIKKSQILRIYKKLLNYRIDKQITINQSFGFFFSYDTFFLVFFSL